MSELNLLDNLVGAVAATSEALPPIRAAAYEYVIAANGLFIRAEDSRMEAMVPVMASATPLPLHGLCEVAPYMRLKVPRVPSIFLRAIYNSAKTHMPNEAMYQLAYREGLSWESWMPDQTMSPTAVSFTDSGRSTIDLHSHNSMNAFFSETDDGDEKGFRLYVVIGALDRTPEIICRVGVYGHFWRCYAKEIFSTSDKDGVIAGPFVDVLAMQNFLKETADA